jgi:hypothetical protein
MLQKKKKKKLLTTLQCTVSISLGDDRLSFDEEIDTIEAT